jgi:hypothetical protein
MTQALRCPGCGQPVPADAPQGLCPACLIRLARDSAFRPVGDRGAGVGTENQDQARKRPARSPRTPR